MVMHHYGVHVIKVLAIVSTWPTEHSMAWSNQTSNLGPSCRPP